MTLGEEYEVRAVHDDVLEEQAAGDRFAQRVALMTAILASIGALFSYESGSAQNDAMFLKNESIVKRAEASDEWAYYQAKSTKAHLDDVAATLASDEGVKARFLADKTHEEQDKAEIQKRAQAFEEESRRLGDEAEATLKPHHRLSLGMTLVQIAVALAAITVLTRRRWLIWCSVGAAGAGLIVAATGFV